MATINSDITTAQLMTNLKRRRPYGHMVEAFFRTGSLKAAAKDRGLHPKETLRQISLGANAISEEIKKLMPVG